MTASSDLSDLSDMSDLSDVLRMGTEQTVVSGNRNYHKRRNADPLQNYHSHPPPTHA